MDTLKNIGKELWDNKPVLVTLVVFLGVLIYFAWKSLQVQQQPIQQQATMPEGQAPPVVIIQPTAGPLPPTHTPQIFPNTNPYRQLWNTPSNVSQAPPQRTITVTPWPTQNSTLSGIAQTAYGNASLWPKIYAANRSKIGNNPNLIYAGTVLVIP